MSSTTKRPLSARHIVDTSHIDIYSKHSYVSFASVLSAFFAGKYWRFYHSSDEVREPYRIDPDKQSVSFFTAIPEIGFQRLISNLIPQWYDIESEELPNSTITYLPRLEDILDIVSERALFKHSLVDLKPSREDEITLTKARVAELYPKIEEVTAIYVSKYLDDLQITILLRNSKYSRSLMDRLLDIEYSLHKEHTRVSMDFLYIPRLFEHREDVIHPKSELIYDRDTSAILPGASVSSTA